MKRLLITCVITIIIGLGIIFIGNKVTDKTLESEIKTPTTPAEPTYDFDLSYGSEIAWDELSHIIQNQDQVVILIGEKEEDATKKVSSLLGSIENIESLNVYYLEKEQEIQEDTFNNLLTTYPDLNNYLNFTPVILVFKNNTLIGGLPGETEVKNIENFFSYTQII